MCIRICEIYSAENADIDRNSLYSQKNLHSQKILYTIYLIPPSKGNHLHPAPQVTAAVFHHGNGRRVGAAHCTQLNKVSQGKEVTQ